jgi:large repetitive protein
MNLFQHLYKALPTLVGRCCAVLLLLVSGIAASHAQPISFSNATVTATTTTHGFQCCNDALGISCGFLPDRPEPRWRVRTRPNVTGSAWSTVGVFNPGNGVTCGTLNWNSLISTYSNVCMPSILVEVQSWEEDGCGNTNTYDTGCANNDENENTTTFTINHQAGAQGTNVNYAFTQTNGYAITFAVNWTATTGGLAAPTALSPTICAGNTTLLTATNTPAVGNHFEWFSDAALTTLLASGTSYTTPSLSANATYYVTEVSAGNCHGPVTTVNVTVNAAPSASITGTATICQNASTTLTATGGGTYAWNTLQTGSSITVSPASSTAYTVTVTAANGCTRSSALAVTVNPAPTTTPYTLCQNGTVMGGLTSDLGGSQALQSSFTGNTITGSMGTMQRPLSFLQGGTCTNSGVGTATPYIAQNFSVPTTGSYTFANCGASPTWDSYIVLYQAPFNPATGCASNTIITADDDACSPLSSVTATLTAGVNYVVVVAGYSNADAGAYTLTASSPVLVGTPPSVEWYTAATGGAPIATGSPFNPVGVAGSGIANTNTAAATTFYAQYPGGVCRTPTIFTINPTPNTPTAPSVTVCSGSNAALSATSNIGTIEWYAAATGGAPISTGGTYNVPNATANASYWAEAVLGTCRSPRVQVDITVTPTPATPVTADVSICAGTTATLSASGTNVTWWNAAAGGAQVGTGSPFTTGVLNSSIIYYPQQSVSGCPSLRASANVTVNPIPAAPIASGVTICNNTTATLSASGSNVAWYDAATGGTLLGSGNSFVTAALTATTTYYAQQTILTCNSPRTAVTVTVNPVPATPVASAAAICAGSNGVFTATASGTIQWYDMASGGTLLGTGGSYNTAALTNNTTIYVQQSETTGGTTCVSARVPVSIVVNAIPAAPITTGVAVCTGTSATVSAAGSNIAWFDAGGSPLGVGNTYLINPLTANTTVYAQQTVLGCTSTRTAALATAKPVPAAPATTSETICAGQNSSLTASPSMSGTVNWYLAAANVNTGTIFNQTAPAAGTYAYSVNETLNGCTSPNSTSTLTVNALPIAPSVANATVCSGTGTTLTAIGTGTIEWFDALTGGNLLQVGSTLNTGALTANTTYYTQQTVAGCVSSPRGTVTVSINAAPTAPIAPSFAICEGNITTVTASGGSNFTWFADAVGLQQLSTGATFNTPVLNSTTIYYVNSTSGAGCVSGFTPVTVTVNALPSTPIALAEMAVCNGSTATIAVTGSGTIGNYIRIYDGAGGLLQGFQISATANTFNFTTPALTATAIYYIGEEHGTTFCESVRTSVTVRVKAVPAAPAITGTTTICANATTTLSATAGAGSIEWHIGSATGLVVGTNDVFTTPVLTANATYYVTETLNGCTSPAATVLVTVNALPNQPNVQPNNVNICRGATATINIQNPNVANTYSWYNDAAATQPANPATGSVYTSNPLNNSTTIYVQTTNANGCKGPIRAVPITVATATTPPAVAGVTICSGNTATLTGTNTNNNTEWFSNPQGTGTPLGTGATYTTGVLTANTTVFAQNTSGQGCKSQTTPVTITVNAIPAAPILAGDIICAGQSTILLSQASGNVTWYNDMNTLVGVGPSYNTGVLTLLLNTYTAVNEVNGCRSLPATVTVRANPIPAAPTATAAPVCRGNAATLTVQAPVALSTYTWFADAGMVTQLGTGITFTTTPLNNTTTYYVHRTASGCTSPLVAVTAQVQPLPPAPTAAPAAACQGATTFSIVATGGNATTEWYSTPNTTGTLLQTGDTFSPSTATVGTTTVFVSNVQGTCRSQFTPVDITINANPAAPTVAGNTTICEGQSTTLSAAGNGNIFWLEGTPPFAILQLGANYTTPAIQSPGEAFVAIVQDANGCQSFTQVLVTANQPPPAPVVVPVTVCAGQLITVTSASGPGTTWYSDIAGTSIIATGTSISFTPAQQGFATYVGVVSPDGCRSAITAVPIIILPLPIAPSAVDKTICSGTGVTLNALNTTGTTNWFTNAAGTGTPVTGTSFPTGTLNATTTYYLSNANSFGCNSPLNPVTVTVNATPAAPTLFIPPSPDYCLGQTITGLTIGSGGVINWSLSVLGASINQTGEFLNVNTSVAPIPPDVPYTFLITETKNGCTSLPVAPAPTVTLHAGPVIIPFAVTTAICEGTPLNIVGDIGGGGVSYLWTLPNGTTSPLPNINIASVNVNDHQGFYSLVVTDDQFGCASETQTVYQEVNQTPTGIVVQTNSPICPGATLALNTPLIGNATYLWSGPNGFTSTTRTNTVPNAAATGNYAVVVTVDGCASVPANADIIVLPVPIANAGADVTIQYGAATTLHAIGGFGYNWSPATLLTNSSTQSPTTIPTLPVGATVYTVTVADANGCTATDAVTVIVSADPAEGSIMNLITPNGDGMNDEFHLPFLEKLTDYTFSIYARAGNLVYSTTNYDQRWAGKMDGADLPDGAYWYIIQTKEGKTIKGAVTIKR